MAEGVAKMYGRKSGRKKGVWKDFQKRWMPNILSKEIVLGHPCIPRVRMDTGSDKQGV